MSNEKSNQGPSTMDGVYVPPGCYVAEGPRSCDNRAIFKMDHEAPLKIALDTISNLNQIISTLKEVAFRGPRDYELVVIPELKRKLEESKTETMLVLGAKNAACARAHQMEVNMDRAVEALKEAKEVAVRERAYRILMIKKTEVGIIGNVEQALAGQMGRARAECRAEYPDRGF